jgi:hypothetical protein
VRCARRGGRVDADEEGHQVGVLLAFAVGYVVGARAGNEGLDEVKDALKAVLDSEELKALGDALRAHASHVLKELGAKLASDSDDPITVEDVLGRLRNLVPPGTITWSES